MKTVHTTPCLLAAITDLLESLSEQEVTATGLRHEMAHIVTTAETELAASRLTCRCSKEEAEGPTSGCPWCGDTFQPPAGVSPYTAFDNWLEAHVPECPEYLSEQGA